MKVSAHSDAGTVDSQLKFATLTYEGGETVYIFYLSIANFNIESRITSAVGEHHNLMLPFLLRYHSTIGHHAQV